MWHGYCFFYLNEYNLIVFSKDCSNFQWSLVKKVHKIISKTAIQIICFNTLQTLRVQESTAVYIYDFLVGKIFISFIRVDDDLVFD